MTTTIERPAADTSFAAARRAMIDSQLRTSGVNAPFALERMRAVPREDFVPAARRGVAYADRAVPLENGGFLPAPLFHAALLVEAQPAADDQVLVVDGGSGYLTELVRPLVAKVTAISPEEALAAGRKGKPCTLLLIDGAVEHIPEALARRVAEGGRIVTGLIENGVSRLAAGRKAGAKISLVSLREMGIPRLARFDKAAGWQF